MNLLAALRLARTFRRRENPMPEAENPMSEEEKPLLAGFKDLPIETVLNISSYLADIDRLCLALTCTSLLMLLDGDKILQRSTIFKATVAFPDDPEQRELRYRLNESPRWKLLQRLEDSRWRLCYGCFKLHPIDEFHEWELSWEPAQGRTCRYGQFAGVARLCPCIEITFRQKVKLIKALRSSASQRIQYRILNSVIDITDGIGRHQCHRFHEFEGGYRATINCELTLLVEVMPYPPLYVEARYDVRYDVRNSNYGPPCETVLFCPHRNIGRHIYDLDRQFRFYGRRHGTRTVNGVNGRYIQEPLPCPWCRTIIFDAWWTAKLKAAGLAERHFIWTSRRDFGDAASYPDRVWYYQTETSLENLEEDARWRLETEIRARHWIRPYL